MTSKTSPSTGEPSPPSSHVWRIFVVPAVAAIVGYVLLYALDSHLRSRRGPWVVRFEKSADGTPALILNQPALGVRDVTVRFAGETMATTSNVPAVVRFDQPLQPVPFGRTAFDDLMYLPGTLVLQCFGHEVQMLPKALYLNRRLVEWASGQTYVLQASEKLPNLEPPKKGPKRTSPASAGSKSN